MSTVDWDGANKIAMESHIKLAAQLWNTTEYCVKEIAEQLGLRSTTVRKYLCAATKIGLCNYNSRDASLRTRRLTQNSHNIIYSTKNYMDTF